MEKDSQPKLPVICCKFFTINMPLNLPLQHENIKGTIFEKSEMIGN
jgi:hypothetical protein